MGMAIERDAHMFGLQARDLSPILPLLKELYPDDDVRRMGGWGILPLCYGAIIGQSPSWQATMFEHMQPQRDVLTILAGRPPEYLYALDFEKLLREWIASESTRLFAKRRLEGIVQSRKGTERIPPDEAHILYFTLAIMLNSLSDFDDEEFNPIRVWADAQDGRWLTLFFAAGLLLSRERSFPWEKLVSALLRIPPAHEGPTHVRLKALFAHYQGFATR
jgi:hypothetical protein